MVKSEFESDVRTYTAVVASQMRFAEVGVPDSRSFQETRTLWKAALAPDFENTVEHPVQVPALPFSEDSLLGAQWKVEVSRPWGFEENITVLDGRAFLWALNRALDHESAAGRRHLFVVDNMSVALTLSKGRSSAPGLHAISRRIAANVLG